jgi:hypothetical protein
MNRCANYGNKNDAICNSDWHFYLTWGSIAWRSSATCCSISVSGFDTTRNSWRGGAHCRLMSVTRQSTHTRTTLLLTASAFSTHSIASSYCCAVANARAIKAHTSMISSPSATNCSLRDVSSERDEWWDDERVRTRFQLLRQRDSILNTILLFRIETRTMATMQWFSQTHRESYRHCRRRHLNRPIIIIIIKITQTLLMYTNHCYLIYELQLHCFSTQRVIAF